MYALVWKVTRFLVAITTYHIVILYVCIHIRFDIRMDTGIFTYIYVCQIIKLKINMITYLHIYN